MNKILFSAFVLLFLYSCTTTRKIGTSAERQVLNDPALKTSHVGISIFEPATNKYWYNHQGDKYFVPASNTKLPTCYAAMKFLADSIIAFNYAVDGETIYIEPTGDPTFLHPDFKNQPAFDLLKQYPVVLVNNSAFRDEHWVVDGAGVIIQLTTWRSEAGCLCMVMWQSLTGRITRSMWCHQFSRHLLL